MKQNNIVRSFVKRTLIATITLAVVSSIFVYSFQKYRFYEEIKSEIEIETSKHIDSYSYDFEKSSKAGFEKIIMPLMEKLQFIEIELYDSNRKELADFQKSGEKAKDMLSLIRGDKSFKSRDFINSNRIAYHFYELEEDKYFFQIFYPIYQNQKLLGYIEGIKYINQSLVNKTFKKIRIVSMMIVSAIVLFAIFIFPIVYDAYRKLNNNRVELLTSNIMTINTLGNAIALRDSDTNEHNYRVTLYAVKLAKELNIEEDDIKKLMKGAFLHDVGKIGISDNILLKNGKLNHEEFEIMKEHVLKGIELVDGNSWLKDATDVILYHHEKYDGSGYPNAIKGEDIPLIARIFSVIDVFDALTSKRPYKDPFSYEKTMSILENSSGSHLDDMVLRAFFNISQNLYQYSHSKSALELKTELELLTKEYFLD